MSIRIVEQAFQPYQVIAEVEQQTAFKAQFGATASFVGTMRDFNDDATVSKMTLEHYPEMTSRFLNKLEAQALEKWPLQECLLVHRVGEIFPGEAIVLIVCWSAHRRAALDACSWLIEALKYQAPFWKKEQRQEGAHWVECNTDGT